MGGPGQANKGKNAVRVSARLGEGAQAGHAIGAGDGARGPLRIGANGRIRHRAAFGVGANVVRNVCPRIQHVRIAQGFEARAQAIRPPRCAPAACPMMQVIGTGESE